MIRRTSIILILTALLFTLMTLSAFATKTADENRLVNKAAIRVVDYAFPDEHLGFSDEGVTAERVSLDRSKNSNAVGELVGQSYYEWQHNSSMHRQIAIGTSAACPWTLHVDYMFLPSGVLENREIEAYGYDGASSPGAPVYFYSGFQAAGMYAGYPSLDVTYDGDYLGNRSIITAHNRLAAGGRYRIQYWFQFECNLSFYGASDRIPDTLNDCGTLYPSTPDEAEVVWPDIQYQDPPDGPPVLHLVGSAFGGGSGASNLNYFQKIDPEGSGDDPDGGSWTYGCAIDTVFNGEGYELAASNNGVVVISWVALLPDEAGCDTCSQNTPTASAGRDRWDNDFYYQKNVNFGRGWLGDPYDGTTNFWENRVNVTKNEPGSNGWRPYADIISMITANGDFHAAWIAMEWDDAAPGTYRSRVFHWGENLGFNATTGKGNIRTVSAAQWDPENCNSGSFNQNQAKLSIAECNSNLYIMWVEMNSPMTTGNGLGTGDGGARDDCAQRAFDGDVQGAANGDLFISVSSDAGLTWDAARPLTDTYGGPTGTGSGLGCDPEGVEGDCPSEHWPSMVEFGSDYTVNPPTGLSPDWNTSTALVGTGDNGYYLDIAYFNDTDPGGAVMAQGSWTNNDYLWMRFPCVQPIDAPGFAYSPTDFLFPNCVKHCEDTVINVIIENIGNAALTYDYTIEEDQASPSGWLTAANISGDDYSVPSGFDNADTILVTLNGNHGICTPGSIIKVTGRVTITHDADKPTGIYEVELVVADTCVLPIWDTVATSCTELIVGTNGNAGNSGSPGDVNMDYDGATEEPDPENATAYLYDSGDIIGWMTGSGAYMNWGMFQATIADSVAFMPQADPAHIPGSYTAPYSVPADYFYTGVYSTNDTSVMFESEWYAPTDPGYSCGFVIKHIKVYVNGAPKTGVTLGLASDWDIPTDSSSYNSHGFGPATNLVWQRGIDWDPDVPEDEDDWYDSLRYGGIMYLGGYNCSSEAYAPGGDPDESFDNPYGMYTGTNDRLVYPYDLGFDSDTLYMMHSLAGQTLSSWDDPDDPKGYYDMHCGMTYLHNRDMASNDTLHFFVAYMSNVDDDYPTAGGLDAIAADAKDFYDEYLKMAGGCCVTPGDFNHDGSSGVTDLTLFVDFMFNNGPAPVCANEFDVNADCSLGVSDLTFFVDYMFNNGQAPVCGCVP
ncbi:MAG: hypothetical protein DRP85_07230 [Candidatus Makaraimicrobium thalassicum]|nr:MAG: hypothetical protein DRP85_07230 [Candidatus Omnitrophota bacterium]